jgi:hypothetical protein
MGSDLDGGSDPGAGSDLGGMGSDPGGTEAASFGAGSFTLDFARRPGLASVAVCGAREAPLSADSSRLPRGDAALVSSRDDKGDGPPPAAGSVARGGRSGEARSATLCLSD